MIIASILIGATAITAPLYVPHNSVVGNTQTMTNITEWAASVTNAIAHAGAPAPSAWKTESSIKWQSDGTAIKVSVAASGALSADLTGWTDGQAQIARITIASGASISDSVQFVGYGYWPTDQEFVAVCIRVGSSIYVNVITGVN